jgi:hypothetical protein
MKIREMIWIGMRAAVGVCSAFVTLHGLYGIYGLDFRRDSGVSALYCIFPFLSFFVFLFVKRPKLEAVLHAAVAVGYLTTYSMLDWRTCAELGYCSTVGSTVLETLRTKPVAAAFLVIVLTLGALSLDPGPHPRAMKLS